MPGSVSIKADITEKADEMELIEDFNKESEEFKTALHLNKEDLKEVWKNAVDIVPADQRDLRSTLMSSVPKIGSDFVLEMEVNNQIQKEKVDTYRQELVPFIRKELNNKFITLQVKVNFEKTVDAKPVSPVEKFKHLAGKNPALNDLQQKFGLEPNY